MANVNVILDNITHEVQLEETPFEGNKHLIYGSAANPVLTPGQSFDAYETIAAGQSVGFVECSDSSVVWSITSGNTNNDFTINGSTGEITTANVLDFATLNFYSLGVRVESALLPELTDSTIVEINVLEVFTACADYSPSYSGTPIEDLVGYLQVEPILLGSGTLGDYAIDWRVGSTSGTIALTTGNSGNTDPSIQAYHPFYEPVQAGELYPVFKYITINGTAYTAYPHTGYDYSPDLLTCLNSLTVLYLTCRNGSTGSTFFHTITYTNSTMNSAVANRSISYQLFPEITEMSWRFYGYAIADRIKTSYVSGESSTLISDWVIGTDNTGYTYTSLPYLYDQESLKMTFTLSAFTYTSGDYILFEVSPSYNDPGNTDTNWRLEIACHGDQGSFNGDVLPSAEYSRVFTGDSETYMVWNSGQCRYDTYIGTYSGITSSQVQSSDPYSYMQVGIGYSFDWEKESIISLTKSSSLSSTWVNGVSYGSSLPLNGTLTIARDGTAHTVTYTFTDAGDYGFFKEEYYALTGSTDWISTWSPNGAQASHYWYQSSYYRISLTSGDTYSNLYIYGNLHEQTLDFDDGNYIITVNMVPQVYEYSGTTGYESGCDGAATSIYNTYVNTPNTWYSGSTTSWETIWRVEHPWAGLRVSNVTTNNQTTRTWAPQLTLAAGTIADPGLLGPRWHYNLGSYYIYKYYLRVDITNESDAVNNWELYSYLNDETGQTTGTWTLIKKVGT